MPVEQALIYCLLIRPMVLVCCIFHVLNAYFLFTFFSPFMDSTIVSSFGADAAFGWWIGNEFGSVRGRIFLQCLWSVQNYGDVFGYVYPNEFSWSKGYPLLLPQVADQIT